MIICGRRSPAAPYRAPIRAKIITDHGPTYNGMDDFDDNAYNDDDEYGASSSSAAASGGADASNARTVSLHRLAALPRVEMHSIPCNIAQVGHSELHGRKSMSANSRFPLSHGVVSRV